MIGTAVLSREHTPVAALAVCAGISLWLWGMSPAGRWLEHDAALMHHAGPVRAFAIFSVAWLLMTVATMMPTALPLLSAFARVVAARPRPRVLGGAVVAGFLATWTVAGAAAGAADLLLRGLLHQPAWHPHVPLAVAATLGLAGAYQLSGLAGACRDRCRSPFGFLTRHWTGAPDVVRQSFVIGADYGRSCLCCCAPLMVVMLVIGMGNLAWMYGLASIAALQKHARWGERLATAVGVALLTTAAAIAIRHAVGLTM